jgi:hypothetical protein
MSCSVESVQDKFNLFTPLTKFKQTNNTACGKSWCCSVMSERDS